MGAQAKHQVSGDELVARIEVEGGSGSSPQPEKCIETTDWRTPRLALRITHSPLGLQDEGEGEGKTRYEIGKTGLGVPEVGVECPRI